MDTETDTQASSHSDATPRKRKITYTRPWLYPKQEEAIFYPRDHLGNPARYSFIEAATKTGKTVGCIAWLFEIALLGPPGNYWWVAPVSAQAKIAYTRMKNSYPMEFISCLLTPTPTISLPGGQIIWFKSGEDPDNLYGDDVQALVIDEASRLRPEAWHACRSTITATRGPVRFIGNVKGRKNWFYAMSRKAEHGEVGSSFHRIIAADAVRAKVLSADEIAEAKRDLPANVYRELYEAEASDDGGNPFGIAAIANCMEPLAATKPVVWGWDLAKSIDWTVGTALDDHGRVCRFERFQLPWPETETRIQQLTGNTPALVDSTGLGDPVLAHLQKKEGTLFEGFLFTSSSKQKLMEGLAVAIQQREVTVIDGVQKSELEEFEYQYTRTGVRYSAPEGYHDDCVCSLALAVTHRSRANIPLVVDSKLVTAARMHRFTPRSGRLG